jgi:hypothetical protein
MVGKTVEKPVPFSSLDQSTGRRIILELIDHLDRRAWRLMGSNNYSVERSPSTIGEGIGVDLSKKFFRIASGYASRAAPLN